ncbi:MAG: hypothetical protein Q8920_07500 [Bacillota bacterium]|nr:hypothetical protein [Bacillota bacterium]
MRHFRTIMWGFFFILAGVLLMINQLTDIDIPVFRTLFGLLIMFIGFSILFKRKHYDYSYNKKDAVFDDVHTEASSSNFEKYSVVFGKQTVDASNMILDTNKKIKFEVVFGEGTLLLDPDTPVIIKADAAFGNVDLPNNEQFSFGSRTYEFGIIDRNEPYLEISANAVFGRLNIRLKRI